MPFNDFICPRCKGVQEYLYYAMPEYDKDHNRISKWPACPDCWAFGDIVGLDIFPRQANIDLLKHDFIIDIGEGPQRISSLTELRAIEAESLKKAENEPGHSPYVFRDFSQNYSNRTVNTLAGSKWEKNRSTKPPRRTTLSGLPIEVAAAREPFQES